MRMVRMLSNDRESTWLCYGGLSVAEMRRAKEDNKWSVKYVSKKVGERVEEEMPTLKDAMKVCVKVCDG